MDLLQFESHFNLQEIKDPKIYRGEHYPLEPIRQSSHLQNSFRSSLGKQNIKIVSQTA